MTSYERVRERFHFSVPDDYRRFWDAGLLVNDRANGLNVSRHSWLSPDEIANYPFPSYKISQLVPFAETPGRDTYCWYVEASGENWIADCPRDSNFAEGTAPSFEGFVFRSLLEEFSDSWVIESLADMREVFEAYTARTREFLPDRWTAILMGYRSRESKHNRWGRPQLIPEDHVKRIIGAELAFPMLGTEFRQHEF